MRLLDGKMVLQAQTDVEANADRNAPAAAGSSTPPLLDALQSALYWPSQSTSAPDPDNR